MLASPESTVHTEGSHPCRASGFIANLFLRHETDFPVPPPPPPAALVIPSVLIPSTAFYFISFSGLSDRVPGAKLNWRQQPSFQSKIAVSFGDNEFGGGEKAKKGRVLLSCTLLPARGKRKYCRCFQRCILNKRSRFWRFGASPLDRKPAKSGHIDSKERGEGG